MEGGGGLSTGWTESSSSCSRGRRKKRTEGFLGRLGAHPRGILQKGGRVIFFFLAQGFTPLYSRNAHLKRGKIKLVQSSCKGGLLLSSWCKMQCLLSLHCAHQHVISYACAVRIFAKKKKTLDGWSLALGWNLKKKKHHRNLKNKRRKRKFPSTRPPSTQSTMEEFTGGVWEQETHHSVDCSGPFPLYILSSCSVQEVLWRFDCREVGGGG